MFPSTSSKLPFLVAGFLSFLLSVFLYFVTADTTAGIFVGLWVPSIFSLGALMHAPAARLAPLERTGARR
jgi:hypothetical protein